MENKNTNKARQKAFTKIEAVRYTGGHSTRKPSTITIAVPHKVALEVAELHEDYLKKGNTPETGLIGVDLTLRYAGETDMLHEMAEKLDGAITIKDKVMTIKPGEKPVFSDPIEIVDVGEIVEIGKDPELPLNVDMD